MSNEIGSRVRFGEAFWRAHHEAWQQSALNQREYCEAHGIPLNAFGNWRAKFKAAPQPTRRAPLTRFMGDQRSRDEPVREPAKPVDLQTAEHRHIEMPAPDQLQYVCLHLQLLAHFFET